MKEHFQIVLITIGIFVAGLLMGIWTQKTRPIPPPPAPVLGEFNSPRLKVRAGAYAPGMEGIRIERFSGEHPGALFWMNRNIAKLKPKIKTFQLALNSIEKEFRHKVNKVLTPEQRSKLASIEAKQPPVQIQGIVPPPPLPQSGKRERFFVTVRPPFPVGGWLMMSMIIYQPSLDHLTSELKLDSAQQSAMKQLMVQRRTELLVLIDKNPPPTLALSDALP